MNIRNMMAAFAALIIAGRATAADTPLPITNITVNAGSVILKWEAPLGRVDTDLHIEAADTLAGPWAEVTPLTKSIGDAIVNVGADTKKFFRLYAEDAASGNNGGYDFEMWDKVDHTIMINLTNNFAVTRLPKDFNVTNDSASATDHLYLRYILPGSFTMGSPVGEFGRGAGEVQTPVTFTQGFYIGVYAVTEAQWDRVMGISSPSSSMKPKGSVSWNTVRGNGGSPNPATGTFMANLRTKVPALVFDLPTEAQREFACRAGTTGTYSYLPTDILTTNIVGSSSAAQNTYLKPTLGQYTWYTSNNNPTGAKDVGLLKPNPAGLYDVHGNVQEWCRDVWEQYLPGTAQSGPEGRYVAVGQSRVLRNGSYGNNANAQRSSERNGIAQSNSFASTGFRLAATGAAVPEP